MKLCNNYLKKTKQKKARPKKKRLKEKEKEKEKENLKTIKILPFAKV